MHRKGNNSPFLFHIGFLVITSEKGKKTLHLAQDQVYVIVNADNHSWSQGDPICMQ